jgi:serine/threonine protein kinase
VIDCHVDIGSGSLQDVMQRSDPFPWGRCLKFAVQIFQGIRSYASFLFLIKLGLNALHSWRPPAVHRDIKSANILGLLLVVLFNF